jgi:hypothetical protein
MNIIKDSIIHTVEDMHKNGMEKIKWYKIFCKPRYIKDVIESNNDATCEKCLDIIKKRSFVDIPVDYMSKLDQTKLCWNCNKEVPYTITAVVTDDIEFETWVRLITKCLKCGWAIDDYNFEVG